MKSLECEVQQCNALYPKLAGREKLGCSWKVNGQNATSVVKYACSILQNRRQSLNKLATSGMEVLRTPLYWSFN